MSWEITQSSSSSAIVSHYLKELKQLWERREEEQAGQPTEAICNESEKQVVWVLKHPTNQAVSLTLLLFRKTWFPQRITCKTWVQWLWHWSHIHKVPRWMGSTYGQGILVLSSIYNQLSWRKKLKDEHLLWMTKPRMLQLQVIAYCGNFLVILHYYWVLFPQNTGG